MALERRFRPILERALREAEAGLPAAARVAGERSARRLRARMEADVEAYGERVRAWARANRTAADPGPSPSPEVADNQEMYRHARQQLHATPPPPRRLRRHWQRRLWVARVCLEREGGAVPPDD